MKNLTTQIDKTASTITRLQTDRAKAVETIESETRNDSDLAALRARRTKEQGRALVLKRKADTTKLDGEIEALENQRGAAIEAANVARAALPIFDEGLRIAQSELANLRTEQRTESKAHIMSRHDAAQARYLQAVAEMESAVSEMVGAEAAWRTVFRGAPDPRFPGRGKQVLEDIRTTGIRVPWDHSRLKDPAVAAGYTDDYRDHWYLPAWAAREQRGFGDACAAQLVADICNAGFECEAYAGYEAAPAARMVRVRVKRGTIQTTGDVKLSASTGEILSRQTITYSVGDDADLEESQARQLAAQGTVVIHGKEPAPKEDGDDEPIGFVTPDTRKPVGHTGPRRMQDGYQGRFHNLGATNY